MTKRSELLTATDETIDDAVKYADPMVLRGLLYQLTGDESIAATKVGSTTSETGVRDVAVPVRRGGIAVVADPSDVALLQSRAAAFLKSYRDQGAGDISYGAPERLQRSLSLAAGTDLPAYELELWLEELALDPWARSLVWDEPPSVQGMGKFIVAVIGAGMGGLNAAVQLQHAGIPYFVIEKNDEVGGTWYENRYPGARVDSPSRTYTHIFGADFEYPYAFCPQSENLKYINWVAEHFDLRKDITFKTEVNSVIWDEAAKLWEIKADGPDGPRVWRANAVIASVGQLGARPNIPSFEGMETFEGKAFHTARWPADLDLRGKRVAVIGTGATGYQTIPEIAKLAGHTFVFQRTPSWVFPTKGYLEPFPPQVNWLDRNFPYIRNFIRFRSNFLTGPDIARQMMRIDPEFKDPHARSAANKQIREDRLAFIKKKFANRPDLIEKMIPVAPPGSSRPVIVGENDNIYDALVRDDVTLVTDPIRTFKPNGIEVEGGAEHSLDIIVYATGFRPNDFLWPMEVRGRGGKRVEELWEKDGARAYLGSMLPGFPNFFMIFGPNTNNIAGGLQQCIWFEIVARFALECIARLITQKKDTIDVTLDAYWRYNDEVDRAEDLVIYKDPRNHSYYRMENGRSAVNNPIDIRKIWTWLRNPADGRVEGRQSGHPEAIASRTVRPYFGEDLVIE